MSGNEVVFKDLEPGSRVIDLRGREFGRWTVKTYEGPSKQRGALFGCICSCENKTRRVVIGLSLRSGESKSCGCYQRVNYVGLRNSLGSEVIANTCGNTVGRKQVQVRCFCGKKFKCVGTSFKRGNTQSCGCHNRKRSKEANRVYNDPNYNRIYFVHVGGKYVKIGYQSKGEKISTPMKVIRRGNPAKCHYLFHLGGDKNREDEIHDFFEDQRIGKTELFHIEDELEYFLKAYLAGIDEQAYNDFVRRLEYARLVALNNISEDYTGGFTTSPVIDLSDFIKKVAYENIRVNHIVLYD